MKLKYRQALFEVYVILENTDEDIKNKISKKFTDFIKENMDVNHKFVLQQGKELVNQDLMLETKQILALIYRDYMCTQEERKKLLLQEKEKRIKKENQNRKKYNVDFEKAKNNKENKNIETSLVEKSQEKWYRKLISKILDIFGIKN